MLLLPCASFIEHLKMVDFPDSNLREIPINQWLTKKDKSKQRKHNGKNGFCITLCVVLDQLPYCQQKLCKLASCKQAQ